MFKGLFGGSKKSRQVASDRLRQVLISDRSAVSPHMLDAVRGDMLRTLSQYVELENDELTVELRPGEREMSLVATAKVRQLRRRRP